MTAQAAQSRAIQRKQGARKRDAKKSRRPMDALEAGAEVLSNAAERAFQQAKKARAEKRRKD